MYSPTPADWRETNRRRWDERVPLHLASDYYDLDAWIEETPGGYADNTTPTVHNRTVEWQHPIGDVVSALAAAGLRIDFLRERETTLFERFGVLELRDGAYRFPADRPRMPLMYSLKASKVSKVS